MLVKEKKTCVRMDRARNHTSFDSQTSPKYWQEGYSLMNEIISSSSSCLDQRSGRDIPEDFLSKTKIRHRCT